MQLLKNQNGFSLVETLIAAALLGGLAITFTSLFEKANQQSQAVEQRYVRLDTEQSVRTLLLNPELCKCNFQALAPASIKGGTPIQSLRIFKTGSKCDQATTVTVAEASKQIPGSTMKIRSMQIEGATEMSPKTLIANLRIKYDNAGKFPIKPSLIKNVSFSFGSSGLSVCGLKGEDGMKPTGCGYGKICFNGRSLTFKNRAGAVIATTVVSYDENGMLLHFQNPSSKTMMMEFKENGDGTISSEIPHPNWKKQFCSIHSPQVPHCALMTAWKNNMKDEYVNNGVNCASPLYWYDDDGNLIGSTEADEVKC